MVAWAIQDTLDGMGCSIVGPATRVNQALTMVHAELIDAAILDINLDGQKSYPVADVLTARGVPFMFSTGYDKGGLEAGYQSLPRLQKPYSSKKLLAAITELLKLGPVPTRQKSSPSAWNADRLRTATGAGGIGLWSWNIDADEITMDDQACRLWGLPVEYLTFEGLSAHIHPEDLAKFRLVFDAARETPGTHDVEFRVLRGLEHRWISAHGARDEQDAADRLMVGVFLDVSERRMAEEARAMLASEMVHRVKNLFSVASGLTRMSACSTETSSEMLVDLTQRLTALSLAHDLVQPELGGSAQRANLPELLSVLLAPYVEGGSLDGRCRVSVPDLPVREASARTIALVVHELATNAMKYGALSRPTGTLHVSCLVEHDEVTLTWTERGGPAVIVPEGPPGFGSELIRKSVSYQLGGSVSFDWNPEGLLVTLRMKKARL